MSVGRRSNRVWNRSADNAGIEDDGWIVFQPRSKSGTHRRQMLLNADLQHLGLANGRGSKAKNHRRSSSKRKGTSGHKGDIAYDRNNGYNRLHSTEMTAPMSRIDGLGLERSRSGSHSTTSKSTISSLSTSYATIGNSRLNADRSMSSVETFASDDGAAASIHASNANSINVNGLMLLDGHSASHSAAEKALVASMISERKSYSAALGSSSSKHLLSLNGHNIPSQKFSSTNYGLFQPPSNSHGSNSSNQQRKANTNNRQLKKDLSFMASYDSTAGSDAFSHPFTSKSTPTSHSNGLVAHNFTLDILKKNLQEMYDSCSRNPKILHQSLLISTLEDFSLKFRNLLKLSGVEYVSRATSYQPPNPLLLIPSVAPASESDSRPVIMTSSEKRALSAITTQSGTGSAFDKNSIASNAPLSSSVFETYTFSDSWALTTPRIKRTRSTSWTPPRMPRQVDYSPRRLMSPPITKQTLSPAELSRKQAKAQELRESFLMLKAEKLRSKADKIQAVKERKLEHSRQLMESIEEKQVKAEKLRESHIRSIQNKAKEENAKRDEITFITNMSLENKKMEVIQRYQETEARLHELGEERQRKLGEVAAMQEAALERRRQHESERLAKLAREEDRKREMELKKEEERKLIEARRLARKHEKQKRVQAFKDSKEAEEKEMVLLF